MLQLNDSIRRTVMHHHVGYYPMEQHSIQPAFYRRLSQLSQQQQWILITSESSRLDLQSLISHRIPSHKVVQLRSSRTMDEFHVIRKAILSGNASAIIASHQLSEREQTQLTQLAEQYQCEVFFIGNPSRDYH
jgi:cell division inhibitor SulA